MWIVSQGTLFIMVHFQPDNHEYKQLWQSEQIPIALLTYSDIQPPVKLFQEAFKSKHWILVVVRREHFCNTNPTDSISNVDATAILCRTQNTLAKDILELTTWLLRDG